MSLSRPSGLCRLLSRRRSGKIRHAVLVKIRPRSPFALASSASDQMPIPDHVRERLAGFDLAGEREKDRPHPRRRASSRSPPCRGSAAPRRHALPDSDGLEQPPRRCDDGRGALILRRGFGSARVGDRNGKRVPSACRNAIASVSPAKPPGARRSAHRHRFAP